MGSHSFPLENFFSSDKGLKEMSSSFAFALNGWLSFCKKPSLKFHLSVRQNVPPFHSVAFLALRHIRQSLSLQVNEFSLISFSLSHTIISLYITVSLFYISLTFVLSLYFSSLFISSHLHKHTSSLTRAQTTKQRSFTFWAFSNFSFFQDTFCHFLYNKTFPLSLSHPLSNTLLRLLYNT